MGGQFDVFLAVETVCQFYEIQVFTIEKRVFWVLLLITKKINNVQPADAKDGAKFAWQWNCWENELQKTCMFLKGKVSGFG
uniref:Uncharacterized protein n=1 Tax=Panagrolaimus sp. JU765 TaxID=591449 RepID=A0AC34Q4K4_9BILA